MAKDKWGTKRKLKGNKEAEGFSRKILRTKGQKGKSTPHPPEIEENTGKERRNPFKGQLFPVFVFKTVKNVILFSR